MIRAPGSRTQSATSERYLTTAALTPTEEVATTRPGVYFAERAMEGFEQTVLRDDFPKSSCMPSKILLGPLSSKFEEGLFSPQKTTYTSDGGHDPWRIQDPGFTPAGATMGLVLVGGSGIQKYLDRP